VTQILVKIGGLKKRRYETLRVPHTIRVRTWLSRRRVESVVETNYEFGDGGLRVG
jgi:hypothetical protein